ncbi:site-specific integrase [Mycolicibacterium septicum]|uniref:tyrosine-type recombinase/integrase n=1 Tax=Mycolicibacterium septicum TaxID=98668 RepID=UPI0023E34731|nr:site-specific integrase [Mycolicibacterium septicum]MDF3336005.1 site-specific integrase [Mycolicibacterium septicum]
MGRNDRAGIDDRWHKQVRRPDGTMATERSSVYGKVTRWRVRWVTEGREHTRVFERKVDAQGFLNTLTAEVVKGSYVSPHKSAALFGDVAEEWIASKAARKPKTVAGYRSLLDTLILPKWGEATLSAITHGDLQKWISGLSVNGSTKVEGKGLSASRVVQAHQCFGAVIKYAMRTERIGKNVAEGIELPSKGESERRYLTHKQLQTLARHTERFETLTLVLGYCGLCFGEAVALRGRDIKDKTITVRTSVTNVTGKGLLEDTTKTGKARWVPVPGFIWERLQAELPVDGDALVFPGREGSWLPTGEYRWAFDPAATKTGVPGLVPHELRHTCASLAIASGANILAVQRLLGHQTASMTLDRYGHLFSDDLTAVARKLDTAGKAARKIPQ